MRGAIRGDNHHMPFEGQLLDVSASNPLVAAMSDDPTLLGIWGYLRLAPRPLTLPEIASATLVDAAIVQRKLDLLVSYGIVESLPSTTRRRGISYRTRYQGLRVRCRPAGDHDAMRRIATAMQQHARSLFPADWLAPGPMDSRGWHADFTGVFNLTPAEVNELRRRLNSVVEFTSMLGAKYASRGAMPELCNYVMSFRVEPLPQPTLPLAPVRFVLEGADKATPPAADAVSAGGKLSARERQTALALVRGLTIAEVATELGLAQSTVATLTKRVYRKLGIRRRAELVSRMAELGIGQ